MRKFKKSGFLKNKSFNIVSRFFLSSFIVISFFYAAPIIINFTDKNFNNKEFTNNSKNILNKFSKFDFIIFAMKPIDLDNALENISNIKLIIIIIIKILDILIINII